MSRLVSALAFALATTPLALATAAAAADCKAEVLAAFEKQRQTKAFRSYSESPGEKGPIKVTVDYMPPAKMHQTVVTPDHPAPIETIAIQRWAWATMGGGWEELQPQFSQSAVAAMKDVLVEPLKDPGDMTCLGKVTYDGKEYLGYENVGKAGDAGQPQLKRTVYIDPATGLPAVNVVSDTKDGAAPVYKGVYSYPDDIAIDSPLAPVPEDKTEQKANAKPEQK